MKLYEVNQEIEELMRLLEPDPETGEIPAGEDEIMARIKELAMKREDILQYLAKLILNIRASVTGLKAEEDRLKARRKVSENKEDHLMSILDRECGGEKTDLGVATLYYRRTRHVEIEDEEAVYEWACKNGHPECYRIAKPEISKMYVGKLMDAG
ncbi:MAG: siphovirus Gp157 family protein, partial [Clostridia bacterium]|nr:siphovirus Gp157 family protein [Clostridia bacterium]